MGWNAISTVMSWMLTLIWFDVCVNSVRYRNPPRNLASGMVKFASAVVVIVARTAPSGLNEPFELSEFSPVQFLASVKAMPRFPPPVAL